MNVVKRDKCVNSKNQPKFRNELLRKDPTIGIRGTSILPIASSTINASRVSNNLPRYQFNGNNESTKSNKSTMGPPLGPPRSLKRKIITNSTSSKPESSSSGRIRPRILASDSAAADTSIDYSTPKNRPTALRYISSSSRGCYSGTRSAKSTSSVAVDSSVILAISEGRGMARGEIGMAAVDLKHPHLVLCQFSDTLLYTHTLTKINYFNPVEIIVPHTFCEGVTPVQLYQLIKDQFPQVNLTTVQRRHFNDAAGRLNIQTLCAPQYSAVYLQVLHKFYALTAAAAVLKYVEYIQCIVFARESLKIEYHSSENTMIIDVGTATQLELVQPLIASAGHTCCLLGVLGPLYTVGGIRALRASILQPSCKKEIIENRLDAVQDLIDNDAGLMVDLQDVIKKLSDIDKILLLCVESTNQNTDNNIAQLNQTILLKTTMEMVPKLVEALKSAESGNLRKIKMEFENPHYNEISERISTIIQDDAHVEKGTLGSLQRCFAVKPNINGLLDVARRTYSELIEDIQKIVELLSETYDLPIRLNQNMMKGFHIVLPIAPKNRRNFNIDDLPPIFIQVNNGGASVTMTTEELVVLDQQSKESLNEIQKMSNMFVKQFNKTNLIYKRTLDDNNEYFVCSVISSLLKELRPFMPSLYKLCENVAELDILVALAHASTIGSYIRPTFSDYLDIKNSVHPLLDYNSQVMPVPNDVFASPEYNFTVITGPNMGGKSIYIKQIAIMQVMAQLGCFLPATNAVLRLCDRLYSRIGFNDSVELNASTFVFEIKEMQYILGGLTNTSLVIIDEFCRGTNEEEGIGIAWAICEELIASDAFTFFTTHFAYLTRLQELYFSVVNLHANVTEEETESTQGIHKRLIYNHKIEPGVSRIQNYGLTLAAKTHLPEDTVNLAIELSELIAKNNEPQEIRTPQQNDEGALYKLYADMKLESRKSNEPETMALQTLRKFKIGNVDLVQRVIEQSNRNRTSSSENNSSIDSKHRETSTDTIKSISKEAESDNATKSSKSQSDKNTFPYSSSYNRIKQSTVKSSTELLNSIMNVEDDMSVERDLDNCPTNVAQFDDREQVAGPNLNDSIFSDTQRDNNLSDTIEINGSLLIENNNNMSKTDISTEIHNELPSEEVNNFSDSSSDIADAITQILEECSVEQSLTNNGTSDNTMSLDDEFISEVINGINEELNDRLITENIILTPPIGFRDD